MIETAGLSVRYGSVEAVAGVEFDARDGAVTGLVGPNGSGKSSLLGAVSGAIRRAGGTIMVGGDDLGSLRPRERAKRLASVAQEEHGEFPLTVWESVLLGRSVHRGGWSSYTPDDKAVAAEAMRRTGITEFAERPLGDLSGGERQRALIARALTQDATHLLLDEPTNHLDVRYQHEILSLVAELPLCTVAVLHDLNLAARYCDRLILLDGGAIAADGDPDKVLRPEVIEPVYRIATRRVDIDGVPQLLFSPLTRDDKS
ncbi:ABC transporter ATP-binding protein [Glycomyces buryatensis]|uniref:ABC transporter ATP-binding protein n=1 Tax=Glycomyces buryatensis TaxID=2570927 RepID=A0A4S8PR19_9ACTN|nr:ABC transporter ATP-binding protein [Glycomyces buryatensis]THV33650.1 ABC transporter ATP-binding protein [Glycomyces buryatensis]